MKRATPRGGFVTGLVVGLLIGLGIALAIALYVTQAPVPFINKMPQRTAEQDAAEAQRNRNWDPNAVLAGKNPARPAAAAASAASAAAPGGPPVGIAPAAVAPPTAAATRSSRDAAAILAGQTPPATAASAAVAGAAGFDYWVQTGAYARSEDAESQRARLGMLGQSARVLEREQAGRPVYRVRIGPFQARADAEDVQSQLTAAGFESNLVRVER